MNVQRSDSVLASFEKPVSASDAASVTVALRKRRERKEIEKRIVEARQDGSSLLLSVLRSIDWQAAEKASSASSRKGGYGTDKNNARDDVIGNNPNILLVSIGCGGTWVELDSCLNRHINGPLVAEHNRAASNRPRASHWPESPS